MLIVLHRRKEPLRSLSLLFEVRPRQGDIDGDLRGTSEKSRRVIVGPPASRPCMDGGMMLNEKMGDVAVIKEERRLERWCNWWSWKEGVERMVDTGGIRLVIDECVSSSVGGDGSNSLSLNSGAGGLGRHPRRPGRRTTSPRNEETAIAIPPSLAATIVPLQSSEAKLPGEREQNVSSTTRPRRGMNKDATCEARLLTWRWAGAQLVGCAKVGRLEPRPEGTPGP